MSEKPQKTCPICAAQTVITIGMSLCKFHQKIEHKHIFATCLQENKRAINRNLIGDLTAEQFVIATRFFAIEKRDSLPLWACAYCNRLCAPGLDHWKPVSLGGASTFANVIPCCLECNVVKSASTGDEFIDYMINVWKSPVAAIAKERTTLYWNLVEQGIEAVYQYAINPKPPQPPADR